ncbi:DUF6953 family protein [Geomonas edaphica]|uniref:DUF6953 family protein n=1 Tax=Geomonas edaphica TaxID=2570226 RepID=UPI0010A90241|nr:hypothetical protein [Geomonas edaphica]
MTPKDVAEWMLAEFKKSNELYQEDAVDQIERKFGQDFVCENQSGNTVIHPKVLKEFRKLTEGQVMWEGGDRYWRLRQKGDPAGRKAD